MKDKKFIPFWMEKPKIEIIEAYAECIHNGEVLLERIEKVIKELEEYDRQYKIFHDGWSDCFILKIIYILKGEIKDE